MNEYNKRYYDRSYTDEDGEYMCFDYDEDPEVIEERMSYQCEYECDEWINQASVQRELRMESILQANNARMKDEYEEYEENEG